MLQWGLLLGYGALALAALAAGRRPALRPLAFGVILLAFPHVAYYALFLIFPDVLDSRATMLFSITLRYQILFVATGVLLVAATGDRWKR